MAYSKQNFQDGQILNAANLETMENGIISGQGAENLLDNSNFRDPVNSRGKNTYSDAGNEYTIDRWKTQNNTNISIENGYINIIGQWELYQIIQNPKDGIYTFAARVRINSVGQFTPIMEVNNGSNTSRQINLDADIGEWKTYILQYDLSSMTAETIKFLLSPRGGNTTASISVEWAAMYKGAYTANTLPSYVPKGKHVEMLNCGVSLQPHNLLDNSDFRNPVNSRGITSTEASGYHIDKWKKENESGKVIVGNGYLSMTGTGAYWFLTQYIEPKKIKSGAVYTIALADTSGSISICSTVMSTDMAKFTARHTFTSGAVVTTNVEYASDKYSIYFTSNSSKETRFAWAVLYEGFYTADTLPAYVPKGKHVEMLNCGVPLAPHNLLDNSYFIKNAFVAQAGLNERHASVKYLGDRWIGHATISASQQNDGIVLTSSSQYADIRQKVNTVVGKTYTYAINATGISNNHRISVYNGEMNSLIAFNIGDSSNEILLVSFVATTETTYLLYHPGYASSGGTAKIVWAALYEGSYTVDTLPAYVPKGKHMEMLNCNVPLTPYNLLDNSDFRIAQAGYGGMHGTRKYACDRWYDTYGFGSFSFNKLQGLTVAYGTNHAYLVQNIEDASLYHGKTMTMAFGLSDGTILTANGVWMDDALSFKINFDNGHAILRPYCVELVVTSGSLTIKWAALYEGSYDASTLPAYQPKGYAAELAECQRYYYPVRVNAMRERDGDNLYACSCRINMRNTPTITLTEFAPYGENSITDFTNCSVNADQDYIYYARLPTCIAHNFGGLAMTLSADL